ncbi:MAG: tRNA (guanosine(37)-N1)-methyltransferase TrmD [Eubacteriaceae bacterium]|nr:tRNA (guanosine(37)-N1)-methyltransferase TrmD [Eubacteriaceae bacterium]
MIIDILTLFPEMFTAVKSSMLGKAEEKGILEIRLTDIRDYTLDKHKKTDETPFGGGAGMVMTCDPIFRALEHVDAEKKKIVYMSPKGNIPDREKLQQLSREDELVILCGHYEGIDQRILEHFDIEEISIGDYILTGGEPAAIVLTDAVARLIPGVLSSEESAMDESVYSGLLEYPHYTKPREYRGMDVPQVLLSGDHKAIKLWKLEESLKLTKERRPDMFEEFCKRESELSKEEKKILEKVKNWCNI